MRTVFHTTIDGYEIVTGFGDATVDPVATRNAVEALVQLSPEGQTHLANIGEFVTANAAKKNAQAAWEAAKAANDRPGAILALSQIGAYAWKMEDLTAQSVPLIAAVEAKRRELMTTAAIYLGPGAGEDLIADADAAALQAKIAACPADQKTCIDGTYVTIKN